MTSRSVTGRGCAPFNYGLQASVPPVDVPVDSTPPPPTTGTPGGSTGGGTTNQPAPTVSAPRAATPSGLARTGSDLLTALALGLVLVAGGSWLLARKERTA